MPHMIRGRPRGFDRLADVYDATRGGQARGRRHARELATLLDEQHLVLDVGIGTGVVALGLRELGFRVAGVDVAWLMLRQAQARLGNRVVLADAAALPIERQSLRQTYSVWLLQHLQDRLGALQEIARVLRPGGRYLVIPAEPPDPDPITDLLAVLASRLAAPDTHVGDLEALAGQAGLDLVGIRTCAPETFGQSPQEAAAEVEARTWTYLHDVSPQQWEEVVAPTILALRALSQPDQPILRGRRQRSILVFERRRD